MPKTVTPLSAIQVKSSKPTIKVQKIADGGGLYLKIKPTGSKSWIFEYARPYTKRRTSLSFGIYPAISLSDARILRGESQYLLAKNIDPKVQRDDLNKQTKEAHLNTFEAVAASWFNIKKEEVSPNYAIDIWRSFEANVFEFIGKIPIHLIKAQDFIETLQKVEKRGALETVKRLTQRINEVMNFAINTGIITHNPAHSINKAFKKPKKEHLPTIEPNQLPYFMKCLSIASIKFQTRCLIEWQLHTITRPSEAAGTKGCEIDFENKLWTIPAERMKKNRVHYIPLTDQSLKILEILKPMSAHREFVFPSVKNPRKPMNSSTANVAIKRMGFKDKLVAHGLRSLASTTLNEQGFDSDVIESSLAHIDHNETRKAYNRAHYLERRRDVMNWWSRHIEKSALGSVSITVE